MSKTLSQTKIYCFTQCHSHSPTINNVSSKWLKMKFRAVIGMCLNAHKHFASDTEWWICCVEIREALRLELDQLCGAPSASPCGLKSSECLNSVNNSAIAIRSNTVISSWLLWSAKRERTLAGWLVLSCLRHKQSSACQIGTMDINPPEEHSKSS